MKNYSSPNHPHRRDEGGRRNRGSDRGQPGRNWVADAKTEWITGSIEKETVEFTKEFGMFLNANGLSTSQIRNVFGELKRIQLKGFDKEKTSFMLLRPKMAYADKRNEKQGLRELKKVFDKLWDKVETKEHFENLVNFMESTLAYHKAFGGK